MDITHEMVLIWLAKHHLHNLLWIWRMCHVIFSCIGSSNIRHGEFFFKSGKSFWKILPCPKLIARKETLTVTLIRNLEVLHANQSISYVHTAYNKRSDTNSNPLSTINIRYFSFTNSIQIHYYLLAGVTTKYTRARYINPYILILRRSTVVHIDTSTHPMPCCRLPCKPDNESEFINALGFEARQAGIQYWEKSVPAVCLPAPAPAMHCTGDQHMHTGSGLECTSQTGIEYASKMPAILRVCKGWPCCWSVSIWMELREGYGYSNCKIKQRLTCCKRWSRLVPTTFSIEVHFSSTERFQVGMELPPRLHPASNQQKQGDIWKLLPQ